VANDSADVTSSGRSMSTGDWKSSATNSRQSTGWYYHAIGADSDRTQRSSTG